MCGGWGEATTTTYASSFQEAELLHHIPRTDGLGLYHGSSALDRSLGRCLAPGALPRTGNATSVPLLVSLSRRVPNRSPSRGLPARGKVEENAASSPLLASVRWWGSGMQRHCSGLSWPRGGSPVRHGSASRLPVGGSMTPDNFRRGQGIIAPAIDAAPGVSSSRHEPGRRPFSVRHVDWVAEDPAPQLAKGMEMGFHPVGAGLGGRVHRRLLGV